MTVGGSLEKRKRALPVRGGLVPSAECPAGRPALVEDLGFKRRAAVFQKRKGAIENVCRFVRSTRSERVVAREYQVRDRLVRIGGTPRLIKMMPTSTIRVGIKWFQKR